MSHLPNLNAATRHQAKGLICWQTQRLEPARKTSKGIKREAFEKGGQMFFGSDATVNQTKKKLKILPSTDNLTSF